MKQPINYRGAWIKKRHDWKKRIGKSQNLSRGAKYLAVQICDTYANSATAICWPSNETLAELQDVSVRMIQRYISELCQNGWITKVQISKRRRGIQLVFPRTSERDYEHDIQADPKTPSMSSQHDGDVAPYIEPKKKLNAAGKVDGKNACLAYVVIRSCESDVVQSWQMWIAKNTSHDPQAVLEGTRRGDVFNPPSRYPSANPQDAQSYHRFFQAVVEAPGRLFA